RLQEKAPFGTRRVHRRMPPPACFIRTGAKSKLWVHSIDLGETLAAGLFLSTAFRNYGDVWVGRIPLLAEEGWRDSLTEAGAPGAKREPARSASAIARSLKRSTKHQ